jgi:hypothetical protein
LTAISADIPAAGTFAQSSGVGKRQENQQHRIAQGAKSGQWTAAETAHLEKEGNGDQPGSAHRPLLNGGHPTNQEKKTVTQ